MESLRELTELQARRGDTIITFKTPDDTYFTVGHLMYGQGGCADFITMLPEDLHAVFRDTTFSLQDYKFAPHYSATDEEGQLYVCVADCAYGQGVHGEWRYYPSDAEYRKYIGGADVRDDSGAPVRFKSYKDMLRAYMAEVVAGVYARGDAEPSTVTMA